MTPTLQYQHCYWTELNQLWTDLRRKMSYFGAELNLFHSWWTTTLKAIAHWVRNFHTLCQSCLHTASETFVSHKKIRIRFNFLRFRIRSMHFDRSWLVLNINRNFAPLCLLTHAAPCLPQNIYTTANCNSISSAIITWDEAAGANAYVVEARGNRKDFYNCTSANTSCTLTDLDCGESLSVWIVATNGECTTDPVLGDVAETGEWFWVLW